MAGNQSANKRLLRVEEAAEFLNIRPSTVRAWLLKRKLPRVVVGQRAVRIPMEALEELIAHNTVPALDTRGREHEHLSPRHQRTDSRRPANVERKERAGTERPGTEQTEQ